MINWIFVVFAGMLGMGLISFYAGVLSARRRNLRAVYVRTTALLGICVAWAASVSALHAESLTDDSPQTDALEVLTETIQSLVETDAQQQPDSDFISRYTDLDVLLAVENEAAANTVITSNNVTEVKIADAGVSAANDIDDEQAETFTGSNTEEIVVNLPTHNFKCGSSHGFVESTPVDAQFASVNLPQSEPEWLREPAITKGSGNHTITVTSDPWATEIEASTALDEKVFKAVANYVDDQIGERNAFRKIRLSSSDVQSFHIIQERYADEYVSSVGPMQRKYARLVFTPGFRTEITQRWQEHLVAARLVKTGFGVISVIGLLIIALGVFKRLGSSVR